MKEINAEQITQAVKKICMDANFYLGQDVIDRLEECKLTEESPLGKQIIDQILENAEIAAREKMPMCQDTGVAVFFVELGQDAHVTGGSLVEAINEGVRQGYKEGYLRKSIVKDPFDRKNTGDNTPAIIHTEIVPGENLKIIIAPKGGGSENMSWVKMLPPAAGRKGVSDLIVQEVIKAGANPCPPIIVGIGIGGNLEKAALLAKKALLRKTGKPNADQQSAEMEEDLLKRINASGVGPQGLGGRTFALAVQIESAPCHIASLPVAVNIQCHASRHKEIVL